MDDDIPVLLSQASYQKLPSVAGWERDPELSSDDYTTYTKGNKAQIAYRGTGLKGKNKWRDLGADILVGLGLQDYGNRFKKSVRVADKAIAKYGRDNVTLTGHSLGGSQSAYASRKTGLKGTGYNTGFGLVDPLRKRTYSTFTNYTVDGDIIALPSRSVRRTNQVRVKPKSRNFHSLLNFV